MPGDEHGDACKHTAPSGGVESREPSFADGRQRIFTDGGIALGDAIGGTKGVDDTTDRHALDEHGEGIGGERTDVVARSVEGHGLSGDVGDGGFGGHGAPRSTTPAREKQQIDERSRFGHGPAMPGYRLGATSFVYPAGWLENVEQLTRLSPRIRDIEVLLFDIDGDHGLPSAHELAGLVRCREQHALSYSLHTPLKASLASADEPRRREGVAQVLRAVQAAACLVPENIVLHVYLGDHEQDRRPEDLHAWRERAARSFSELQAAGLDLARCCVELIDYDLRLLEPVIEQFDVAVALDVGHLHRDRAALELHVLHWLPRTRIVQWHGTDPSDRDHRSLSHVPKADASWLLRTLRDHEYTGVLTLEVFRPDDFLQSLEIVQRLESELGA
jgi:sugar phosphate isomerase/epimerase